MRNPRDWLVLFLLTLAMSVGPGCATVRVTDPPRTATEQFLMTTAAQQAVDQLAVGPLQDRLVYVDPEYFDVSEDYVTSIERQFVIGAVRAHLLNGGVRLAPTRDAAQIILEMRSGGLGVDRYDYLLGLPPVLVPAAATDQVDIGGSGTLITPEIAILKNIKQKGYASVAYVAFWKDTGEVVLSSGPFVGRTYRSDWYYFGFGPNTTGNIPTTKDEP